MLRKVIFFSCMVALSFSLSCGSKEKKETGDEGVSASEPDENIQSKDMNFDPEGSDGGKISGLTTVNFEYDKANLTSTARTNLKENARMLLTTYGYAGTGISIDKMTAIVFLTPRRAQMKQIIPRILRRGGDLSITRRIIDIIDKRTPMQYQYGDRSIAYDFYGMQVVASKVQWMDL